MVTFDKTNRRLRVDLKGKGVITSSIQAVIFFEQFITKMFRHTEKLEELYSLHAYTYHLCSIMFYCIFFKLNKSEHLTPKPFSMHTIS